MSPVVAASFARYGATPRVCPEPHCRKPHRDPGAGDLCAECRRRPAGVPVHGVRRTRLTLGDAWEGEFGSCFVTLPPETEAERARLGEDLRDAQAAARLLTRRELAAWLERAGVTVYEGESAADLRTRAVIRQIDLWWPRCFAA